MNSFLIQGKYVLPNQLYMRSSFFRLCRFNACWLAAVIVISMAGCQAGGEKQKESGNAPVCNFDQPLRSAATPALAKKIFNDEAWDINNDEVLSFLDSLEGAEPASRPFYFRVVTNSYKKADGYYAESLGQAGKQYIEDHTREFLHYFDDSTCFTANDLQTWVDIVMLEFSMMSEDEHAQSLTDDFIKKVESGCSDCTPAQHSTLALFSRQLRNSWTAYLKHIEY